jgi:hypothetical protein
MDCARKEVLPGLQAWRKSAAKGERGSRGEGALFQAVAAQLLGRILAGFKFRRQQLQSRGFDFAADLATSYLGEETGEAQVAAGPEVSEIESEFSLLDYEMDRVWGRLLGSSSNSDARESGRIVQSLRAMYTSVQSQLDAFVAATDNSFEVRLLPTPFPTYRFLSNTVTRLPASSATPSSDQLLAGFHMLSSH